nr:MAG TPA: hypothetical protein [Caudoviricetes sp.]
MIRALPISLISGLKPNCQFTLKNQGIKDN